MTIVRVRDDGGSFLTEEVTSLRQAMDDRKSTTYLMTKVPTSRYLYPGSYGNIDKVVVTVTPEAEAQLDIVTAVDPLLKVINPKRVTAEAIAYLKHHHEEEVKRQFLHQVFHEKYMVLPPKEIMVARTSDNKDYVLCGGSVWEITANDQLVPVYSVPNNPD